jgi:dTDP-4-amino-4,6-dideoxygalactose transaminase
VEIKFNDLYKQWQEISKSVLPKLDEFFESSQYIDGPYLHKFETNFAKYTNSRYAIGVSNGTDALKLCIQSFNFNGKTNVVMPANTYIADAMAVTHQFSGDFTITLIDCDDYFQIDIRLLKEYLSNNRSKFDNCLLLPVHLYGHPTDMIKIEELAETYDCKVMEDASQAHGARFNSGEMIGGARSDVCVYSLYPGKNLGAIGDAGIITTNSHTLYKRLKTLRNYGSSKKYYFDDIGWNNRLDPLQAIILDEKLKFLDQWNVNRRRSASLYNQKLNNLKGVTTPKTESGAYHVYHIYCLLVERREDLQKYLEEQKIPTVIHYPIPIQLSKPFLGLNKTSNNNTKTLNDAPKLLSLPMHPYLSDGEIDHICHHINEFYS